VLSGPWSMFPHMAATALADGALEQRLVGRIEGHFYVPSYQRGYRCGEHEVKCLLDDIAASDGERREAQSRPVVRRTAGRRALPDRRWRSPRTAHRADRSRQHGAAGGALTATYDDSLV